MLVLFSKRCFAIDQIIKQKDSFEISIIRIDRHVHLWGLNILCVDGSKKVIGPENIELSYQ